MGDVASLAAFAQSIALDSLRQNHGRRAGVLDGGFEGRVNFLRIMPAPRKLAELLVGKILHEFQKLRVLAKKILADVSAGFHRQALVFAIDDFAHALDEQTVLLFLQERVPIAAPDDLDDVPAGAAKSSL